MNTLEKLLALLTPHERKRAVLLLVLVLFMALMDVIGVASIMPFMAIVANPDIVDTNKFLYTAYVASWRIGVVTKEQFLFATGVCALVVLLFSLAFKAFTVFVLARYSMMREYSISSRLIEGYLHQPYSWFLNRHSADIGKTILSEVGLVVGQGIAPMINLIAQSAVVIALVLLLSLVNPKLAFIVGVTLGLSYVFIFKISRRLIERIGYERLANNERRFTILSEAFGAYKQVKISSLEEVYVNRFSDVAKAHAWHQATAQAIGQIPRFAIEAVAFGGMLLLILFLMRDGVGLLSVLPVLALYAFAGYRLMPALQQIYVALTQLRFVGPSIDLLYADIAGLGPRCAKQSRGTIQLRNAIMLNNVTYRYPGAKAAALRGVNLVIPANSTVGIVGSTGSGKTTSVDLILGLLEAQGGSLEVDGQKIVEHNIRAWQRIIGYVPQQIYLADDTVTANIAFGVNPRDIDHQAIERAAKIANLHEFVCNDLPEGYATAVGENGVRLSGGQCQRIGIARALYHNPQVLILDEATSALDNLTEQAVMEAVSNLGSEITIILIAHRLSTVRKCDQIYLLAQGEVKAVGTYDQLATENEQFATMSRHA